MQYLRADARTQRSDEITMENPNIVHGHGTYSDATTISVNWQKNIIQHLAIVDGFLLLLPAVSFVQ